jgi:hypothetical protein
MGVLVSENGGRTFSGKRPAYEMHSVRGQPGLRGYRGDRATGADRSAVDMSHSQYRGRIYILWSDYDVALKRNVVRLVYSSDLGKTWGSTMVDDNTTDTDPNNPTIAINNDGVVAVVWNDRRDDPKDACWRLYGAISIDGGEHFMKNAKLSDAPTCPNAPKNWQLMAFAAVDPNADVGQQLLPEIGVTPLIPTRWPNGGDTYGLVADAAGNFHTAWINGRTGTLQLWQTDLAVDAAVVARMRATEQSKPASAVPSEWPPAPAGCEDVSTVVGLKVTKPEIDFTKHSLSFAVQLSNPTDRTIQGPIDVIIARLVTPRAGAMGLQNLRIANADAGGTGIGASWRFSGSLAPRSTSTSKIFRFSFDGGIPEIPAGYLEPKIRICAKGGGTH